jgi:hypothetical protein
MVLNEKSMTGWFVSKEESVSFVKGILDSLPKNIDTIFVSITTTAPEKSEGCFVNIVTA